MLKKIVLFLIIFIACGAGIFWLIPKKNPDSKKEVIFWTLQLATFDKYVNNVIKDFEKENPDIKIKWVDVPYSEGEKRTLAAVMSNTPPDLINLNPDFSFLLAQKGALTFFDEKDVSTYNPSLMQALRYKDRVFGLPFYATSSITMYNKSALKKAKITTLPRSYDELYALAKPAKANSGLFITMPTLSENDTMLKILNKNGINSPEKLQSQQSFAIFNLYKTLYSENLIPKESITQTHREVLEKYMSGELIFLQAGANFINLIKENAPQVYKDTDITYQIIGSTGKYDFSLMNLIIPERAGQKDAALKFALFLTNKNNQLEFSKLTNVLPTDNQALNDQYFTNCNNTDLASKARCIAAKQLKNTQQPILYTKNQKDVITLINMGTQEIVIGKKPTEKVLESLSKAWNELINSP